jgi:hypothetical protein
MARKRKTKIAKQTWAWKMSHPFRYAFQTLKDNAKRRGKEFKLTYDEFIDFDKREHYIRDKGRGPNDASIDRPVNSQGYTANNIQILTVAENSAKGTTVYDNGNPTPF